MKEPKIERTHPLGGIQRIYRFDNGYGASVVRFTYSYGFELGLWELAVIKFNGEDYELVYDTEITNDVIGYLSEDEVDNLLTQIEALPSLSKDDISPSEDNISPSDEP